MAQTTLAAGNTQATTTQTSGANAGQTVTIAAGGKGSKIRLLRVTLSCGGATAAADTTLTINPDASTASWVEIMGAVRGPMADRRFSPAITGLDNTAMTIVVSAAGVAATTTLSVVYDYKDTYSS